MVKLISSKFETSSVNLLKVNSLAEISTSGEGETTALQNSLLLMIYIKRILLTRGLFRDFVFKAVIFCSVILRFYFVIRKQIRFF